MKKLTAGIFTALLGLVTVNAANAAIPSTNYVDEKIDVVHTRINGVESAYEAADTALGARIDGVETAYKAADSALDGRVKGLETTVGKGTMVVATETQADVIAAINALDAKTNGIASNTALETLQNTVNGHETDITGLETRMTTAEGEIDALQGNVQTLTNADTTNLQAAKDYADGELAKKVNIAQGDGAKNHVVITNADGNVTTSATITQAQVANLTTDLAAKMTDVTAVSAAGSEDGVYVLTAKIVGDETTYKWELIQRYDNTPK